MALLTAANMAQRLTRAARGAQRQLRPRVRQLSAFRDAYLVRNLCPSIGRISGFAPLDGLILARTRSRSTAAARAPPPRAERRRIAPHLPNAGASRRGAVACRRTTFLGANRRRRRAIDATEARITDAQKTQAHVEEREQVGIVPKPLDATQTAALVEQLKQPEDPPEFLLELLKERVPPEAWTRRPTSRPRFLSGSGQGRRKVAVSRCQGGHEVIRNDAGRL